MSLCLFITSIKAPAEAASFKNLQKPFHIRRCNSSGSFVPWLMRGSVNIRRPACQILTVQASVFSSVQSEPSAAWFCPERWHPPGWPRHNRKGRMSWWWRRLSSEVNGAVGAAERRDHAMFQSDGGGISRRDNAPKPTQANGA
jgi:hypothetical protein